MLKRFSIICWVCLLFLAGCEDTDVRLAAEAGLDAVKAVTLSDENIRQLAMQSADYADAKHAMAPADDRYARRLQQLVGDLQQEEGVTFNYKVYLATNEVNAFAMADGTIRLYSGLMDMLDDGELRFVIGHEMGHVAQKHIRKKMQLAYASSALRKGIASQSGVLGEIARSQLGGFTELIMGAQFSQLEEKEADDYGLSFLKRKGYNPQAAVSALQKLAALGDGHSFLSSHPAPGKRAERLELQLQGKAVPIEESKRNIFVRFREFIEQQFPQLFEQLNSFFPWLGKET